jgi:TPR repeat protein
MKYWFSLISLLVLPLITWAETEVFFREYTHTAGDADSKITSRQIAHQEIKRELLNEVGTHIYSRIEISENASGEVSSRQEMRALTAGFVKMELIEEKWNGYAFYIKAKMIVDPEEVSKQINELLSNETVKTLLKKQLTQQAKVVEELRSELLALNAALRNSQAEQERINISQAYTEKSKEISANDFYEKGLDFTWGIRGESINHATAMKWYAKAVEQGHPRALYDLSLAYYEGKVISQNYVKAADGMKDLARLGMANAQYQLSVMFRSGHGVTKDYEEEMYWLEMAAEQDLFIAQISLDERYAEGGGVPKSSKRPIFWLTKSAERGDALAQYKLAIKYKDGLEVDKSRSLFRYWLNKAKVNGNKNAIEFLKGLKSTLMTK